MKFKNLLIILTMLLTSTLSYSKEDITILWAFNIGSNQSNIIRLLIEDMNSKQDRYRFILQHKPGAGGTIAANAVDANPGNTVVAMSSTFIIRPHFSNNEVVHDLNHFQPVAVLGTNSPLLLVSKNYKTFEEYISNPNASVGLSGTGSISYLAAEDLMSLNKNLNLINFKSMIDATVNAAGGHVDASFVFYNDAIELIEAGKLNLLAYTGTQSLKEFPGKMLHRKNLPAMKEINAHLAIYGSTKMDETKYQDIHNLITAANQSKKLLPLYEKDKLVPEKYSLPYTLVWFNNERLFWRKLSEKVKK